MAKKKQNNKKNKLGAQPHNSTTPDSSPVFFIPKSMYARKIEQKLGQNFCFPGFFFFLIFHFFRSEKQ